MLDRNYICPSLGKACDSRYWLFTHCPYEGPKIHISSSSSIPSPRIELLEETEQSLPTCSTPKVVQSTCTNCTHAPLSYSTSREDFSQVREFSILCSAECFSSQLSSIAGGWRGCNYPPVSPKPTLQPRSPSMQRNGSNDTWNWGLDPLTPSESLGIFLTISWMRGLLRSHLGN